MPPSRHSLLRRALAPLERAFAGDARPPHPALILSLAITLALGLSYGLYALFSQVGQSARRHRRACRPARRSARTARS